MLLKQIADELGPLERFDEAMQNAPAEAGVPLRNLLDRCIALRDRLPELSALEKERLPQYADWLANSERIESFEACVKDIQPDGILAHHPLAVLSPEVAKTERPLEQITGAAEGARRHFERIDATLGECGIASDRWGTPARARVLVEYAKHVAPITRAGQLSLLDPQNPRAAEFARDMVRHKAAQDAVAEAQEANKGWRNKLPADEVLIALEQARSFEGSFFAWLKPAWWRLRGVSQAVVRFQVARRPARLDARSYGAGEGIHASRGIGQGREGDCGDVRNRRGHR